MESKKELPEVLFSGSSNTYSKKLVELSKQGKIKKIAPRIYTSNFKTSPSIIVRRNIFQILAALFPGARLSHRTALEYRLSPGGRIYLTDSLNRTLSYPGVTVVFIKGGKTSKEDSVFLKTLRVSSLERALLENLQVSRSKNRGESKCISREDLEKRLVSILEVQGEAELNRIRDRARGVSKHIKMQREFNRLNDLISAILGTRSISHLESGVAQAIGEPYDGQRVELFTQLLADLKRTPIQPILEANSNSDYFRNKAFIDAYFSNFIEGTEFDIREAEAIVFDKKMPASRPKDAKDIVGTFEILSDPNEMKILPRNLECFFELLKARHLSIMKARSEIKPGIFKARVNRVGQRTFVSPSQVRGTLAKGFELYESLDSGFQRAAFMMFLLLEVHPFEDGNGRLARLMMNAEFFSAGEVTLIIPNVYREDYTLAIKALTIRQRTEVFIKMLVNAQKFTSKIDFTEYPQALREMTRKNWFLLPDEGRIVY